MGALLAAILALQGVLGNVPAAEAAVKGARPTSSGGTLQSNGQVNAPEGTPTREIQEIELKMDDYDTRPNPPPEVRTNNAKIKRDILNGTFDLRELARLALDKHWSPLSPEQQNSFVALLTELLETKAIFSKEHSKTQGKSYLIQYLGDTYLDNRTQAKTRTKVVIAKENVNIEIDYRLKRGSGSWKIYDVIVDDASLVDNYRYQFDSIITKNGYPELVNRMQKKLAELRAAQ
jgi:phospholipid transport system substrate-binding protein